MRTDAQEMQAALRRIEHARGVLTECATRQELAVADALVQAATSSWQAWEAVLHLEAMVEHAHARTGSGVRPVG